MGWARLAIVPRGCEALQELIEFGVATRNYVKRLSRSKAGELVLHAADLIEKPKWVKTCRDDPESLLHGFRDCIGSQEPEQGVAGAW